MNPNIKTSNRPGTKRYEEEDELLLRSVETLAGSRLYWAVLIAAAAFLAVEFVRMI